MTRLLIGLAMLISSDITAASNSKLRPGAIAALKSFAVIRAATVATATYATYSANGTATLISYTFPPASIVVGNQIRFQLWGSITNTSGGAKSFSPSLYVTQGSAIQSAAFLYTSPNGTSEWIIDGAVSFSGIGPPPADTSSDSTSTFKAPSAALAAGSMIRLANRTGVGAVSWDFAVVTDPNTLLIDNSQPIGISVRVNTGVNQTFTVLGGWMEAL